MMERKPEVRFREFDDDWEQRKLGDCCREFKSGSFIPASDIEESGEYPVFGGNGLRGYTSEYNHDGEFALIGRQGALCGNMNYSTGKAYFTEHAVAVQANDSADTKFMYYLLGKMNLGQYSDQSAQPGLAVGKLVKMEGLFPSVDEQKKIGKHLASIDNLITLHQRKHEKLLQMKKAMLAAMFPEEGENEPRVRFREFAGAWKKVAFGDLYQNVTEKNDMSFGVDRNITVAAMQFKADISISNESYLRTYNVCRLGDIAFEGHKSNEFRYGRFVENDIGDGIVSHIFSVFRPKSEYDINFWKYYINNERVMRPLLMRSTKSSTMMHDLVVNDILKEEILVPTLPEQHRIGAFFQNLESLIAVRQKKLAKLQNLKKALLQKMFL